MHKCTHSHFFVTYKDLTHAHTHTHIHTHTTHNHSATSPGLSDVNAFKFFARTIPSDVAQARAMVVLIVSKFRWKHVNIIAGSDSYSRLGGEAFQAQAKRNGVRIVRAASFITGSQDVAAALATVVSGKCLGTVVFGQADDVVALLREGRKKGYTGEWITSELFVGEIQRIETSLGKDAKELLNGVFSTAPSKTRATAGYSRFQKLWLAQQPTASKSGSKLNCSNATDSSE